MSYQLHITRSRYWSEPENRIRAEEWQALLNLRQELAAWLSYEDGVLSAKDPSLAQMEDMLRIAADLKATVQGDDGERYVSVDEPPIPYRAGLSERAMNFIANLSLPPRQIRAAVLLFEVGARVRSPLRGTGTVITCDPSANQGLGTLTVQFDDGGLVTFSCVAHGLDSVEA
jgi:hypothetical protein